MLAYRLDGEEMDDADITLEEDVARYTDNTMAALADCLGIDLEPFARPWVPLALAKRAVSEEEDGPRCGAKQVVPIPNALSSQSSGSAPLG